MTPKKRGHIAVGVWRNPTTCILEPTRFRTLKAAKEWVERARGSQFSFPRNAAIEYLREVN